MKIISKTLITVIALAAASVAFAEGEAADPQVKAREDLMKSIAGNTKVLADLAGGKVAFDADAASQAKEALVVDSGKIAEAFKDPATDPVSEAKPEIWTSWDDFVAKAGALNAAAMAIDVSSAETIGAGMGAIGGACKDCHTSYRAMN
ncbi:c-type cytochrome [Neotabrizicola shimadae]|uniref:Cytochrome c n=1 Tax=Neotabrizicola shimadae TaxID=2807096 RepID=A0A8G0ZTG6_9RHOB|nr:cytochrome c [Neotabrizicola shimadae]QYZ69140.1 cytochrome c [Neotabrizicola shimadae]